MALVAQLAVLMERKGALPRLWARVQLVLQVVVVALRVLLRLPAAAAAAALVLVEMLLAGLEARGAA